MSNFTPRAQQVLALARKEADRLNHNFLGTEHLLLGLIKLGQGVAVNVLQKMGLDLDTVRLEVEKQVGSGPDQKMIGNIPYTPRVKKVIALAQKMNEMAQKYYDTSRPAYCARYGFVDEIVNLSALRGYLKAFAGAVYQNPKSICPRHQMLLPRVIKG